MVYRGVSRGCITCKKRRVKCDEAKPTCSVCVRVGRKCEGYAKLQVGVRFKDLTAHYMKIPTNQTTTAKENDHEKQGMKRSEKESRVQQCPRGSLHVLSIPGTLHPKQLDMAVAFYLRYITDVGRNVQSTRGFLEFIRPVLTSESHESALSTAVNAAAIKLWALLRPSDATASRPIQLHQKALLRLHQAISTTEEKEKDATVLATLVLQHLDSLIAVFDHHEPRSTHRNGALALLTQKGGKTKSRKYHSNLLGNVLHSRISFCVRHKVSLTATELQWFQTEVIPALPKNPSSLLDVIGISISRLQTAFSQLESQENMVVAASKVTPAIIQNVDAQLRAWADEVPDFWRPRRIPNDISIPSSIFTYHGSCDIYPSVQVANIWNTWRIYRLIVESIRARTTLGLHLIPQDKDFSVFTNEMWSDSGETYRETLDSICRSIPFIESICRSIPFYLGSFTRPLMYSDIDIPLLVFPSYHDLRSDDPAFTTYKNSNDYASKEDHCRHTALHGPLYALTILSSLTDLLSERPYSKTTPSLLDRQKQWINEQLNRCLYLTRLDSRIAERRKALNHLASPSPGSAPAEVVQAVRQALTTVTIL